MVFGSRLRQTECGGFSRPGLRNARAPFQLRRTDPIFGLTPTIDVFLSHSAKDKALLRQLAVRLRQDVGGVIKLEFTVVFAVLAAGETAK